MARKPAASVEPEVVPMLALIETPDIPAPKPVDQARIVLLDAQKFDQFYDRVKGETDAQPRDVSTPKGREAVRALAFRVTKTATTLDKSALELTEDWRSQTKAVNDARKPMVERLKTLAAEVRRPLTEWEEAEAARYQANRDTIAGIYADAIVTPEDTAEGVAERGRRVWAMTFDAPQWIDDEAIEAEAAKQSTVATLVAAQKRLKVEEAEKAELAQLRADKAAREAREAEEAAERERVAAEEAAERARVEAEHEAERQRVAAEEQAERDRIAAEQAEAERIAAAERAAEQRVREEAEAAREAERAAERAEHERELAAERERAAEAERQAQAERDAAAERERAAQAERDAEAARQRQRDAEAAAEAEVERKRQANRAHRGSVQREVKEAIMTCGVDEDTARKIVTAIVAGNVPHCTVAF